MPPGSNHKDISPSDGAETFWHKWQRKATEKEIQHSIHMLRTNPTYRKDHPAECRDNPECKKEVHPEALKRITKDMEKKIEGAFSPTVKRPERRNR